MKSCIRPANKEFLFSLLEDSFGKKVDLRSVERWSQTLWEARPTNKKQHGTLLFPPPNITGNLHLGHALTATIQDAYVRHKRMNGINLLWKPGFDHAGLGAQQIVENLLMQNENLRRKDVGKDRFLSLIHDWKDKKREEMIDQLKRLGLCLDYNDEFYTLDEHRCLAVRVAFKQLFQKGLISRHDRQVYWSPSFESTLSDIEVEKVIDKHGNFQETCIRTGKPVTKVAIKQWYLDTRQAAQDAINIVKNNTICMIPTGHKNTWSTWLTNPETFEWCLSRQSWWGHSIPAYKYKNHDDVQENWVVADSIEDATKQLENKFPDMEGSEIVQDTDVLDTWFSSALLPLSVSGWPNETLNERIQSGFYPLDLMETGFDILNFWVSKMVMISLMLTNEIPFRNVVLHGMICDTKGKKMSKSKGNVIDPTDIIDGLELSKMTKELRQMFPRGIPECASDGLRGYLLSYDLQANAIKLKPDHLDKFRKLSNKLWNIYRFISMNIDTKVLTLINEPNHEIKLLNRHDQILVNGLVECIEANAKAFDNYDYYIGLNSAELFCTKNLSREFMPHLKFNNDNDIDIERQKLFVKTTLEITKILHPFMPHITEFLYQKLLYHTKKIEIEDLVSISDSSYPSAEPWLKVLENYSKHN